MPDGPLNPLIARQQLVAQAMAEKARREAMGGLKAAAESHLLEFVRMFWRVLEPEKPLIEGWLLELLCDTLMAVTDGHLTRVCINVPPGSGKSQILNCFWPAWEWGPCDMPHLRYLSVSYSTDVPERDNIRFHRLINDPVYRQLWGDRVQLLRAGTEVVENHRTGWKRVTSTGGSITGLRGDRLLLDDLNNPKDVESETVRQTTVNFVREIMPDRLNDLAESAIINLQQRTHEKDATGTLVEYGQGYQFVCVPMEFDPLRISPVVLRRYEDGSPAQVWVDPRSQDKNGRQLEGLTTNERGQLAVLPGSPMAKAAGSLCWPERFSREAVEKLKAEKGPYAWSCNPGDAPILMADLTMKPLADIQIGDEIVGFEAEVGPRHQGDRFARRRLVKTVVRDIHASVQPVVRVTFEGGEVIRCTANHKWFTGRTGRDETHPIYAPAKVGRALRRICPPSIPMPETSELIRDHAWLAGFFDGEGTVSINVRSEKYPGTPLIGFSQGAGKNAAICEKLEAVLDRLGFAWGKKLMLREEGHQEMAFYWLKRGGVPLYQRFLHAVQPVKWRERLTAGAYQSGFVRSKEKVVSIEPCGEETVYGLTTDAGNYVVWGLASSNSQYDQYPGVRGGGVIKKEWWNVWTSDAYPPLGTIIVSVDTAVEENNQADFNACTVWGAFEGDVGQPLLLLLEAWRERMPLAKLVERVERTCRRRKTDFLLIEHKTRGRDVNDELQRLYGSAAWATILVKAEQSKLARLKAVEHLFSGDYRKDAESGLESWTGGIVYAPDRDWADEVIEEVAAFPYGANDDYVDTISMTLGFVRKNGVVVRKAEFDEDRVASRTYRRTQGLPYQIGDGQ